MYPALNTQTLLCALACGINVVVVSSAGLSAATFENTAITRTIDLGGALTQVTTTYAVRALENNVEQYYIALSDDEERVTTWIDAKLKGQSTVLDLSRHGFNPKRYILWPILCLPK
jgi:oligosaccharyltransferase complex subunit alpha (ribophorin I)